MIDSTKRVANSAPVSAPTLKPKQNPLPTSIPLDVCGERTIIFNNDKRPYNENKFYPTNFGCEICKSSNRLDKLKDELFKSTPEYKDTFKNVDAMPDYYSAAGPDGKRACYKLFAKPVKSGDDGFACDHEQCVLCNNLRVTDDKCNGKAISCGASNAQLTDIVTKYNDGKYSDARVKINALFQASNTQISNNDIKNGLGNCYMVEGAPFGAGIENGAVSGASIGIGSYADQIVGFCGYKRLSLEYQVICACASMTNMDSQTCRSAIDMINGMIAKS